MSKNIGKCKKCGIKTYLVRGYCANKCYCKLKRSGKLKNIVKKDLPKKLTKIQEEILIGSLLGDGSIFNYEKHGQKNAYFTITRKQDDFKYLKYEFELFKKFCSYNQVKCSSVFDKRTQKFYHRCKFATRPTKVFDRYWKEWYKNNVKIIPKKLKLTPLICAIWFCDDGCITIGKTNRLRLKLSTHGFSKEENLRLSNVLKLMFNEQFSIVCDDGNYFITASDAGAKTFIKYIQKHIPKSMKRKIKWDRNHFKQKRSPAQIKNRNKFDLNEKESLILKKLLNKDLNPKKLLKEMNKYLERKFSPSGLWLYLNRYLKYNWVIKYGIFGNHKDPVKYKITNKGKIAYKKSILFKTKGK